MNFRGVVIGTLAAAAIALTTATAGAQTAPVFHVTDLTQTLPGCTATALNDAGVVAANCPDGAVVLRPDGTITRYGLLTGGTWASPTAVNSLGVVVGDADPGNGRPNPFITANGRLLNIDPISGGNARSVGVTDNGIVYGNMTKSLSGNTASWNVVMWTQDPGHPDRYKETILPHYPGGDSKYNGVFATGSNKAGQVAGWVTTTLIGQLGGFWNNDAAHTVVPLQPLAGGNHSIAWGINDLGQTVGESNTLQSSTRAVMWQNDASHSVVDLGTLPGDAESNASYINTAGQIVGISYPSMFSGTARAFFFQNGTMYELAGLVNPTDGVWTIASVFGLNNAGQILAIGSGPNGTGSILLTPVTQ